MQAGSKASTCHMSASRSRPSCWRRKLVAPAGAGAVDGPSARVTGIRGGRRRHRCHRSRSQSIHGVCETIDPHQELEQIGGRGNPSTVRIHSLDWQFIRRLEVHAVVHGLGVLALSGGVPGDGHLGYTRGSEDQVANGVCIIPPINSMKRGASVLLQPSIPAWCLPASVCRLGS